MKYYSNCARNGRRAAAFWVAVLFVVVALPSVAQADEPAAPGDEPAAAELSAAEVEFFEKQVRPLLVANCYECHAADKQQGNLRLDSRIGWMRGGDSGPAIARGEPDSSLLMEAVRYESYEMPPSGKLKDAQIATLEKWITMGAPDPRNSEPQSAVQVVTTDIEAGRKHWAYQPIAKVAVPTVRDKSWPHGAIDAFVLARLEEKGIQPVADASPQVLVRRVYLALTGLPPTPEQISAFVNDKSPDAYERLVDWLLASPEYGERWGRHWLDVARYAESVTLRGLVFDEAWRYRDYVIDAFNRDLPYDQFVREQIAGDLLPAETIDERSRQMIATTFLMMGNTNLEEQDKKQLNMDVVDEQIDTLGKALLAQTIACARCHDHKFDPIPTRDYYAIAGILRGGAAMDHANVSKWVELPLPLPPDEEKELKAHESAVAALQADVKKTKSRVTKLTAAGDKTSKGPAILAVTDLPGLVVDSSQAKAVGDWKLSQFSQRYIGDGYLHDINAGKGTKTLTFQPEGIKAGRYEVRLAYSHGGGRAIKIPITILHAKGETVVHVDQRYQPPIDARFVSLGEFDFEQGNQGYVLISNEGTDGHVTADAIQFLRIDESAKTADKPADPAAEKLKAKNAAELKLARQELSDLERQLKKLTADGPRRPMVMTLREEGEFKDLPIHIRGSVHNLGEVAPRGFLHVASRGVPVVISDDESGRRQLAEWLASSDNPLTARVMVNRVWHWLFGQGLVRTTDNFGTTGEGPSHPELLDHLAARFIEQGWSVKQLVREIVLSHAWQLSSAESEPALAADPQNRLLWRMNRQRLDAEAIRDTMLLVSGQLCEPSVGATFVAGLSADYGYKHSEPCRSVYVPVFRNALPDLFEVFDFPDPSMVTGARNASTVAPQALFLMNSPFVMEQALATARRLLSEPLADDAARVKWIYQAALGRAPTTAEGRIIAQQLGEQLVVGENSESERVESWARVVQSLFASPEFRYVQ